MFVIGKNHLCAARALRFRSASLKGKALIKIPLKAVRPLLKQSAPQAQRSLTKDQKLYERLVRIKLVNIDRQKGLNSVATIEF